VRSRAEIRPTPRANADLARRYSSAAQRSRSPKEATASRPAGRSRMPSRQTLNFPERHVHCDPGRAAPSPCQARTCRPRRRGWRRCTPRPGGPAPRPARLAPRPAAPATACRCRWAAAQQRRGAQGIAQAHCDPYLPLSNAILIRVTSALRAHRSLWPLCSCAGWACGQTVVWLPPGATGRAHQQSRITRSTTRPVPCCRCSRPPALR
jgi:hypothetical protein